MVFGCFSLSLYPPLVWVFFFSLLVFRIDGFCFNDIIVIAEPPRMYTRWTKKMYSVEYWLSLKSFRRVRSLEFHILHSLKTAHTNFSSFATNRYSMVYSRYCMLRVCMTIAIRKLTFFLLGERNGGQSDFYPLLPLLKKHHNSSKHRH